MSAPTAYLLRTRYAPTHTAGVLIALDEAGNVLLTCVTLELPWRDNKTGQSAIPEGTYPVRTRESHKFGLHYHVQNVPGRDLILFHPGTYVYQLMGCILPGAAFAHLDKDQIPDITHTRATLNKMLAVLGAEFTLHVLSAPMPGGTLPEVTVTP